jgi:hypothetical protein
VSVGVPLKNRTHAKAINTFPPVLGEVNAFDLGELPYVVSPACCTTIGTAIFLAPYPGE